MSTLRANTALQNAADTAAAERRRKPRTGKSYGSRKGQAVVEGLTRSELVVKYGFKVKIIATQIAKKLPASIDVGDLESVGLMGLMDAADRFDPKKGAKFETYAAFRIRGAILDELRSQDWVPRSVRDKAKNDADAIQYAMVYIDDMTPSAAAAVRESDAEEKTSFAINPIDEIARKETRGMLEELFRDLTDHERTIMSCYYFRGLNMKEVAEILDLSEPRICQLHSRAILKLRTSLTERYGSSAQTMVLMLLDTSA